MKFLPKKSTIKVQREQVSLLYAQGIIIQLLGMFASAVTLFIFLDIINHKDLFLWFFIMVFIYILRLLSAYRFNKVSFTDFNIPKWKNLYILSTFLSGIVWGTLALFMTPEWSATHQVALYIIFTGIIAAAVNTNSSVLISYVAFYIPPTLILMYTTLRQNSELFYELGFLFLIYIILIYSTSLRFNKNLVKALELRFDNEELANELKIANEKLTHLADIDELSQLGNRRSMNKFLLKELEWHYKEKKPLALLVIDIDFFKQYNDTYGHLKGDRCIVDVAKILKNNIRENFDLAVRYGGEEYVIILHDTTEIKALNIAQKIFLELLSKQIEHSTSDVSDYLTLSIGLSSMIPDSPTSQSKIFDLADNRLYKAKQNGRNQIVYK